MYLIGGGNLITGNADTPFIDNGAVVISEDSVVTVGTLSELRESYSDIEFIDAQGGIIMPGLIDLNMRSDRFFHRGFTASAADDLNTAARSYEAKIDRKLTLKDLTYAAYASAAECIRHGITAVFDLHSGSCISGSLNSIASAYRDAGIRACVSFAIGDDLSGKQISAAIEENRDFSKYCAAVDSDKLTHAVGVRLSSKPATDVLSALEDHLADFDRFIIRADNGYYAEAESIFRYRLTQIGRLDAAGVLGKNTVLECMHLSDTDSRIEALSGTCIVPIAPDDGPVSGTPYDRFSAFGDSLAAGTDFACRDLFESARSISARLSDRFNGYVSPAGLLFGASHSIASRFFGKKIGVIEPGAAADIIILELEPYMRLGPSNALDQIARFACGRDCTAVFAGGQPLMLDRKLIGIDEKLARIMATEAYERICSGLD